LFSGSAGGGEIVVRNAAQDICMTLPLNSLPCNEQATVQCGYFDTVARMWKSDGCKTEYVEGNDSARCCCDHLTDFALRNVLATNLTNANFTDIDLDDFDLSGDVQNVLDKVWSGDTTVTPEEIAGLATATDSDVAKTAALSQILSYSINLVSSDQTASLVQAIAGPAVAANPQLAQGLARGMIQAVPSQAVGLR